MSKVCNKFLDDFVFSVLGVRLAGRPLVEALKFIEEAIKKKLNLDSGESNVL